MAEIALGVKVFSRVDKAERLLNSIGYSEISKVYIADDGEMTDKKQDLYDRSWEFETEIIDLEYDAGLGYGRAEIVERLNEEYLLIVDSDHTIPENVGLLKQILDESPKIGGVSGLVLEYGHIRGACNDLFEHNSVLIRDVDEQKQVQYAGDVPYFHFDFIPNVALFRKECLEEYCWDQEYVIGSEHIDFYVGHMKNTDWIFATCPSVLFPHWPGGSSNYLLSRQNTKKLRTSREYFLQKWSYDSVIWKSDFMSSNSSRATINGFVKQFLNDSQLVKFNFYLDKIQHPIYITRNIKHRVEQLVGVR